MWVLDTVEDTIAKIDPETESGREDTSGRVATRTSWRQGRRALGADSPGAAPR